MLLLLLVVLSLLAGFDKRVSDAVASSLSSFTSSSMRLSLSFSSPSPSSSCHGVFICILDFFSLFFPFFEVEKCQPTPED